MKTKEATSKTVPYSNGAAARAEVQDYLEQSRYLHRLLPRAVAVGVLAGLLAVVFRAGLNGADLLREGLVEWAKSFPLLGLPMVMALAAGAAALSVALVRGLAPEASGSGIPQLKAVLHKLREIRWLPVLLVKFVSGVLSIGSGLALGREGPTVQMGGAAGAGFASWLGGSQRERLTLIAAGAGAGLAASFNAPLAGLVFVLEEMQRDFRPTVFNAALIASVTADVVSRSFLGQMPIFAIPAYAAPDLGVLPAFVVLGLVAGVLGVGFNRGLLFAVDQSKRLSARGRLVMAGIVGGLAGLLAWVAPLSLGGGHGLAESALSGKMLLTAIPIWFLARFVFTLASYGTGTAGGIFAPLLVLGAMAGLGVGQLTARAFPGFLPQPAILAVGGMAALFAAIVRAPLTGVILIVEMTGNYELMLPLLVAGFGAYFVAESLGDVAIYEALLERDLKRGAAKPQPAASSPPRPPQPAPAQPQRLAASPVGGSERA